MKFIHGTILSIMLLQLIGCRNTVRDSTTEIYSTIDIDNTQDLIDLKLTDIADNFRIIPLETKKECLLDNHTDFFFSEKYILAYSENGVYKFSAQGKFIKKLFGLGRGPNEFFALAGFCYFLVDEKNDRLYIEDQFRHKEFLVYDLNSEVFLNPIKKVFKRVGSFHLYKDSLIIGSNHDHANSSQYAIYIQNFNGELISGITSKKKIYYKQDIISQSCWLNTDDTTYYVSFIRDDTLFKLKGNKLIPYIALKFNTPRDDKQNILIRKGDRFISYQSLRSPNFIIISIRTTENIIKNSSGSRDEINKFTYLFFDKITGLASKIKSYTDDFIGTKQDVSSMGQSTNIGYLKFPSIISNNKLIVVYTPTQIKETITKNNLEGVSKETSVKLHKLNENLKETDNPILLIGILKSKV